MDLDRAFVSQMIALGAVAEVADERISAEMIASGTPARKAFSYCMEFLLQYGTSPTVEIVQREVPEFRSVSSKESWVYLKDELRGRFIFNGNNALMIRVRDAQKAQDPKKALEEIQAYALAIADVQSAGRDVSWTRTVDERVAFYEHRKAQGGLLGLATPWPSLNYATQGISKGQYVGVVAKAKIGKTWVLSILAAHFHSLGLKVGFFSKEMGSEEIMERLDAYFAKLPFSDLHAARLMDHVYKEYLQKLELLRGMHDLWIFSDDDGAGVASVAAKAKKYKPDIILIDGFYLMEDDRKARQREERLTNTSRDLKRLCRRTGIPVVVSAQIHGKEGHIMYTSALMQDCDWVAEFSQTQDMRTLQPPQMKAALKAHRQGGDWEKILNWDLVNMNFAETFDAEDENEDEAGNEMDASDADSFDAPY